MPAIQSQYNRAFTDSRVWMEAHKLSIEIFKLLKVLPEESKNSLVAQMGQEAITISSNIALAELQDNVNNKSQHLKFAESHLTILENQLLICKDMQYIGDTVFQNVQNILSNLRTLINEFLNNVIS